METLSKTEYAKRKGWSQEAASMFAKSGRIVLTKNGKVDVTASDARFAETEKRPAMAAYHAANRAAKDTPEYTPDVPTTYEALATSRAQSEAHKAALLKLDLDERNGVIVRADDVRRAAAKAGREAKAAILNISARIGPLVAAEADPAKCIAIIDAELRAVCAAIAGD